VRSRQRDASGAQARPLTAKTSRIYPAVLFQEPRGVFRDGNRHDREGNGESQLFEDGHAENGSTADRAGRQVSGEVAT
jgi:hypothetical protein